MRAGRSETTEDEMKKYTIYNVISGHRFGEYEAGSYDDALNAFAREAGYENYATAYDVASAGDNEVEVKELN
jgi:hypothetical protein